MFIKGVGLAIRNKQLHFGMVCTWIQELHSLFDSEKYGIVCARQWSFAITRWHHWPI